MEEERKLIAYDARFHSQFVGYTWLHYQWDCGDRSARDAK